MKLKLSQERGIAILDVFEDVSLENVSVLRAGITKLLSSGKNKIILNLVDCRQIPMDIIKELVKLHLTAAELKGQIVLVAQGDLVLQAVKSFSVPPPVKYFTTREAALRTLSEEAPKQAQVEELPENAKLKEQISHLEMENKALKAKLQGQNPAEIKKLRLENGQLQAHLSALEEQHRTLIKDRKKPFEVESMSVKIHQLEMALAGFLEKENLVTKK